MEKLEETIFNSLNLPEDCEYLVQNKVLYLTKWEWNYNEFLSFQKEAQEIIRKNRDHKVYIFCNHPHCFTLGRGNERGEEGLIHFDPKLESSLSYPVYKIHRGGGITFHFPGQWIFYPIVSINQSYTLEVHMCWMLKSVKEVLRNRFGVEKAMATKKLMGVWVGRSKMASIGVGVNRFVTEHGLALNLIHDENMFAELSKINPCGINPTTYITLDKLKNMDSKQLILEFNDHFRVDHLL